MKNHTAVYRISKNGQQITFDSEKDACAFLVVAQCSVASCYRRKAKCKGWDSLNDEIVRALISDDFNKGIFPGQRSLVDYPTFFNAMAHSGDYLAYYKKKISTGSFPSDYLKFYRLSDDRTLADIWNKIQSFSTGGFPTTGQLFIANETGPELVGSMGNKTTVANNQQIVAGIARGVADANAEQNELLRRQNELLVAILQKEGNVTLDGRELLRTTERAAYNRGVQFAEGGLY